MDPVKEIIEYFDRHPFKSKYLLPILDDTKFVTDKQKKTRIQTMLKKVNGDLKDLGGEAKIKTLCDYLCSSPQLGHNNEK